MLADRVAEVKVSLRTRDPSEAKIRETAVAAYLEGFWRLLRAGPQRLTRKPTIALAGELYRDRVSAFEVDQRSAELWRRLRWGSECTMEPAETGDPRRAETEETPMARWIDRGASRWAVRVNSAPSRCAATLRR